MSASKKTATKAAAPTASFDQFEDFAGQATASLQENFEKITAGFAEAGEFGKGNVDAVLESASTYAKGVESIATEQMNFAKDSVEKTVEQFKTVSTLKSPQEFFQAQTEFMRNAFETNMAQINKLADMWSTTAKDSVEPLNKRYATAVEKVQAFRG